MRFAAVFVGLGMFLVGVGLWSPPLAVVAAGVVLTLAGLLYDDGKRS